MKHGAAWALGGLAVGFGLGVKLRSARRRAHEELDAHFHAAYDRMRETSARAAPTLVLLQGSLILTQGSRRRDFAASHPLTSILQAVAHGPVAIFALLRELALGSSFAPLVDARLKQLRSACARAQASLARLSEPLRGDAAEVIERSCRFIDAELARGYADERPLNKFASEMGPLLLRLIDHATQLELSALHEATDQALACLDSAELPALEIVVAGAHQARARSLGMQYFQKRFGEAAGEERRVAYSEATGNLEEARSLVGTRRLDRAIASAFFGDPKRLQRDVLGDAAKSALDRIALPGRSP